MTNLRSQQCVPCRKGEPPLSRDEIEALRPHVPAWEIEDIEGIPRLRRTFKFKNFALALAFTNKIGELAEAQDHHPTLTTTWGRVDVEWYTTAIENLHRNDFIMAARTDEAFAAG